MEAADLRRIVEDAGTIELVDWPHADLPATLHRAGYDVVGHEPDGYKRYEVVAEPPVDPGEGRAFPLADGSFLVGRTVDTMPDNVAIVVVFRPPAEQPDLLRQAVEAGARVFWIHPGIETAPDLEDMTDAAGLVFVDGMSILDFVGP
ncbi:MAG: uncharacterized protein QOJ09_2597 [Actinomycetota bacterium]|nr:uncharacterized protein [Actinomycetota bacterium]